MNFESSDKVAKTPARPEPESTLAAPQARRLFLHEPGWQVALKVGSERTFCYTIAPGQDYYHRLLDGELYVYQGEERICLGCAERRGLLSYEPKSLRTPMLASDLGVGPDAFGSEFDLKYQPGDEG